MTRYSRVVIESFIHKGLKELFETGKSAKVPAHLKQRSDDVLQALDAAASLKDLNLPGFQLHPLHGSPVRHSIHVSGQWCITFEWQAPRAYRVDLEQYH
ncbi:MAG TPA: type II toxin-antitoxin system RelE/ParE family toxin [Rhizomicrobium sp.]|jgi:proteic killer suppression protein|nr:type II toxin-antitoxin system RelE/ParE family toxin [Rhizomicrobium sp.]